MPPRALVPVLLAALAAGGCGGGGGEARSQPAPNRAQASAGGPVRLQRVGSFEAPTYVASPPGDVHRLFVTERAGRIRIVKDGRVLARPFLDISGRVQTSGESGLLSLAFAPDYARSRRLFVYYVDHGGTVSVDSFRASRSDPDRAAAGSRRVVLRQAHHHSNHKGGQLQFGPDHLLYMGLGDGGGEGDPGNNAQNLGRLFGKLLRIQPLPNGGYRIPRGNPFVHRSGARGEIYAYGLRNPFRFSFDRAKGGLVIGDVGQDAIEEIDYVPRRRGRSAPAGGENFGWPVFEGRSRYRPTGTIAHHYRPILQHTHSEGFCSIIGGYVIRDRALGRGLYGRYVYGDLCAPALRVVSFRGGRASGDRRLGPSVPQLVSFGQDARGRLYAVSLDGPVYRLRR